jgi:hypothetical protein
MSHNELENFRKNLGNLISLNGYLSASIHCSVGLNFARTTSIRHDMVRVLFEVEINLDLVKTIVVADVSQCSAFSLEAEMLIDLGKSLVRTSQKGMQILSEYFGSNRSRVRIVQTRKITLI